MFEKLHFAQEKKNVEGNNYNYLKSTNNTNEIDSFL